jgi:dUTP pyrophosphatase
MEDADILQFRKLSPLAIAPRRTTSNSAGLDLYNPRPFKISAGCRLALNLDLQIRLPRGTYGRIAPRSGMTLRYGLDVGAGVIDPDYTGNLGVILFNHSDEDLVFTKGFRIAQLICEKIVIPKMIEVKKDCELDYNTNPDRGHRGWGSSDHAAPKYGPLMASQYSPCPPQGPSGPHGYDETDL